MRSGRSANASSIGRRRIDARSDRPRRSPAGRERFDVTPRGNTTYADIREMEAAQARFLSFTGIRERLLRRLERLTWDQVFPIIPTLQNYRRDSAMADIGAGLAAGIMSVPQGMSYALLAQMPPINGLYNGVIHPLVYVFFGTSRHASMGVSAIENLLCAEAISRVFTDSLHEGHRTQLTIALSLCVGLWMFLLRVLRLGVISNLLADPVLAGFASASGLLIATSQLQTMLGLSIESSKYAPVTWWRCLSQFGNISVATLGLSVASILFLHTLKHLQSRIAVLARIPSQLILVILSVALSYALNLENHGVAILRDVSSGVPYPALPQFTYFDEDGSTTNAFALLLREALPIALMYFVIHMSIIRGVAYKGGYAVDPEAELVALSATNSVGSLFNCFPCATSISRTTVLFSSGAQTSLHGVFASSVVLLTLLWLTPLLYCLPKATLASIVIAGVMGIIDVTEGWRLFHMGGGDVSLWLVAFVLTLCVGPVEGVLGAVSVSLILLLKRSARPSTAILGRLPATAVYRNVKRFPTAEKCDGITIFRFDASLNFANALYFEQKIIRLSQENLHSVVVDASSINELDITAVRMLSRLNERLSTHKVNLYFSNWKGPMRDFLEKADFYSVIPAEHCFLSLHHAVLFALRNDPNRSESASGYAPSNTCPKECSDGQTHCIQFSEAGKRSLRRGGDGDDALTSEIHGGARGSDAGRSGSPYLRLVRERTLDGTERCWSVLAETTPHSLPQVILEHPTLQTSASEVTQAGTGEDWDGL